MTLPFTNTYFYLLVFLPFIPVIWPLGAFQESDFAFFGLWFVAGGGALFLGFGKNEKLKVVIEEYWVKKEDIKQIEINKLEDNVRNLVQFNFTF